MITATISRTGLKIEGHAGAAPYGYDIVCAGVSALVQTFKAAAEQLTDDTVKTAVEPETGQILGFDWGNEPTEKTRTLVDALWIGLAMIEREYPEYVKLTLKSEDAQAWMA